MVLPSLSVLISTYNDRDLVDKKLAEIQRQTIFGDVEFVFVETASPERERELLQPFCAEHPNCRLLTTDEREPLFAAWNRGWGAARGDWVCYTNMDDAMHPQLLETVRGEIADHDWDLLSVLIAKQPDQGDGRDGFALSRLARLELSTRPGPFTAWRRDLLDEFGGFEDRFVMAGDKDFWSRAIARGLRIGVVGKVLYLYTVGSGQLSKQGVPERDQRIMDEKPYPMRWPAVYSRKARLYTPLLRLAPGLLAP
jgi:glycosyltransferase involved in cell wall biosynthesis